MFRHLLFHGTLAVCLAISAASSRAQNTLSVVVLETFDYPLPSVETVPLGIDDAGQVVGYAKDQLRGRAAGFLRSGEGVYTKPIFLQVRPRVFVAPTDINNRGLACGYYFQLTDHGFFLHGETVTTYDYPGGTSTQLYGINDTSDFVGSADTGDGPVGFANLAGESVIVRVPEASKTVPHGINNLGQIAGYAYPGLYRSEGFFRDATGQLTTQLRFPGADFTEINGLNDQGTMVGTYTPTAGLSIQHGFILTLPNQFTSFDIPGSASTTISAINNEGIICGSYASAPDYVLHGYIALIQ